MKKVVLNQLFMSLATVLIFVSCKKKDIGNDNKPPVAVAGPDVVITLPADSVLLDGSKSSDADGKINAWRWTKISGPAFFTLSNTSPLLAVVKSLKAGTYQFELKVTDDGGLSATDTVQVTVAARVYNCGDTNRPSINFQLIPVGTLSEAGSGAVASAGGKILFAHDNSTRVDMYDITANSWSKAELSKLRFYGIATVASESKVFFSGGEVGDGTMPTDVVDIYDVSTNTWTVSHLSLAGENIAAAAVGDKVLFAGGDGEDTGGDERATRVDIYNVTTKTWSATSLSEYKIKGHVAVTANNKVYIAGGENWYGNYNGLTPSNKIDIYDNATNAWSTATMQEAKSRLAGISVSNKIYWAGGLTIITPTENDQSCSVEIKNVNTGSSTTNYLSLPTEWSGAVAKNNKIIFFGGHRNSTNANSTRFEIYDISTDRWSIGVMPIDIVNFSLVSVNNVIYVAGGQINGVLSDKVWKLEF